MKTLCTEWKMCTKSISQSLEAGTNSKFRGPMIFRGREEGEGRLEERIFDLGRKHLLFFALTFQSFSSAIYSEIVDKRGGHLDEFRHLRHR